MRLFLLAAVLFVVVGPGTRSAEDKRPPEPRLSSLFPATFQLGETRKAVFRGVNLTGARGCETGGDGLTVRILNVEPATDNKTSLVHVEFSSTSSARPGPRALRLITPAGITNDIVLTLSADPVLAEADVPALTQTFPIAIAGRIAERGEVDMFWFKAEAGQSLTFHAKSGHNSFDPSVSILERTPTWLDPSHLERIASNDEPLFFPGLSTDSHLVHTFARAGIFAVSVESANGQGSADSVYELRISPGKLAAPPLHPKQSKTAWEERQFTRRVSSGRQQELARRVSARPFDRRPRKLSRGSARLQRSCPGHAPARHCRGSDHPSFRSASHQNQNRKGGKHRDRD
jgi:hypothetical protein